MATSLLKLVMMETIKMGMDVQIIVLLNTAGVVKANTHKHQFVENSHVEMELQKEERHVTMENQKQKQMIRSTVRMTVQHQQLDTSAIQNLL